MTAKIPPDEAFQYYVGLGHERSYAKVAEHYGASKRAVTALAARENWAERLAKVEQEARSRADERAGEALDEMNERHLRIAKALQGRALEALRGMPLESPRDVIRALEVGVRQERLVRGEPTERTSNVEEIVRREYERWMVIEDGDDEGGAVDGAA